MVNMIRKRIIVMLTDNGNFGSPAMCDKSEIPAARIAAVDLVSIAKADPRAAKEIEYLGELLHRGEETGEGLRRLGKLLYDVGENAEAEYLLRRNLEVGDDTHALYLRLFGSAKEEEFFHSIKAFQKQFEVHLELLETTDFLESTYRSSSVTRMSPKLAVLRAPCEVEFNYSRENAVEADVVSTRDDNEYVILLWHDGMWVMQA